MRCDIIIPIWNQHLLTEECVLSISKHTHIPHKVIIIDNASDDETRLYLESLKTKGGGEYRVVRNETNEGFIKAVNAGARISDAPYVCVLNNDTLVTEGWLEEMVSVMSLDPSIGIVNPSSNNLGQHPAEGETADHYARTLNSERGRYVELGAAIGFCMLIKREVIDRVGLFDEIYGMGNFEDTDLSRRAIKEGFKCVRACASYVWHRQNASFKKLKAFESDFRKNREIFELRWGKPMRIAYVLDTYDPNAFLAVKHRALAMARGGNWIWFFMKEKVALPEHSNIIGKVLGARRFYPTVFFKAVTKKKKFDEIHVGSLGFGRILEFFSFLHRARVNYF